MAGPGGPRHPPVRPVDGHDRPAGRDRPREERPEHVLLVPVRVRVLLPHQRVRGDGEQRREDQGQQAVSPDQQGPRGHPVGHHAGRGAGGQIPRAAG